MTKGEMRVRTSFNVGGSSLVDQIKQDTAKMIDKLQELLVDEKPENEIERLRLVSLAQTSYETAAMWAVKAATL